MSIVKAKPGVQVSPKTLAYVSSRDTHTKRCNRCGRPVLRSDLEQYVYQCMECDEDLFSIEVHDGAPHTAEEFDELLLNTEAFLEQDA